MPVDFTKINTQSIHDNFDFITKKYAETYTKITELKKSPELINFKNTIQPLINLSIDIDDAITICTFPRHVHTDKEVRDTSVEASAKIEKLNIDYNQEKSVFNILKTYEQTNYQTEKAHLSAEENCYFQNLMLSYKRNGMYLRDEKTREQIANIKKEIAELATIFEQNLAEDKTQFIMSEAELSGLPKSWFNKEREASPGHYTVTLSYPDVFPILDFAENRETRKKIHIAFESRCESKNTPILKKILILRQQAAKLLGYSTHADYVTEIRMAKDAKSVDAFLTDMNKRFDPLVDKNIAALTDFARKLEGDSDFQLQQYDRRYYARLREESLCRINMEEIREYFPMNSVVSGTLKIYEHLFGLKFKQVTTDNLWHPDCMLFDVYNQNDEEKEKSQNKIGSFYLDLHPRDGKYGHACAINLSHGCRLPESGLKKPTIATMLCNFPKNENIPFDDVVTFFHEFGHVIHFICSNAALPALHSEQIELDFIEAPSQMLENWCFAPEALKILSSHYQTKEPLPKEIAEKLKLKDQLHAGLINKRQLLFGHFDYLVHTMSADELEKLNIKQFFNDLQKEIMKLPLITETCFPASFAHLVGGYDAGYYGYLMSETYATDMFATVFKKDPLSSTGGMKYRKQILEPGATQDAMVLLKNFLGREPTLDAFLEKSGLENPSKKITSTGVSLFIHKNSDKKEDPSETKPRPELSF